MTMLRRVLASVVVSVVVYGLYVMYEICQQAGARQRSGFTTQTDASLGSVEKYIVFRPHVPVPVGGFPVILFLNGQGENGHDGTNQLSNNFGEDVWEIKGRFPFICVAVQCRTGGAWKRDSPDTRRALAILEDVLASYPADRSRVCLTGPSAGGNGVLRIATAYPELFAAIVPVCANSCGQSFQQAADVIADSKIAIWSAYNRGDSNRVVNFNRSLRERLIQAGASPLFIEIDRTGHNAWDPTYKNPAVYEWMLRVTQSPDSANRFSHELSSDLRGWTTTGLGWSISKDGILTYLPTDEGLNDDSSSLLFDSQLDDFSLHFDYRSSGDRGCVVVLRSGDVFEMTDSDTRVLVEPWSQGSGGVVCAKGWVCGADPIGQRAFRPNDWNDVRVQRSGNRLTVFLNGWPLIDTSDPDLRGGRIGFHIPEHRNTKHEWRYVRLRASSVNDTHAARQEVLP